MSKHEEVVKYITNLVVGTKISVRSMANLLSISEGTAYRAIKDCESIGIVTTIPRIGTIRVEKVEKKKKEVLTFADIVNIVDGNIAAGKAGVHKTLDRFMIAAMTPEAIEEYISPGSLLIVGNREEVQELALLSECGIIITGGFKCSDNIKKLANKKEMPVICSLYDTFTVGSMINKAMEENMTKKDIVLVEDIMDSKYPYLKNTNTISEWKDLMDTSSRARFPVINEEMKLLGIVSLNNLSSALKDEDLVEKVMDKNVVTIDSKITAAYASYIMESEGIHFCPVIENKKLIGIIRRNDIIRALKYAIRQPKSKDNLESIVLKNFKCQWEDEKMHFQGKITPEMLDPVGTASWSSLNMLLSSMAILSIDAKDNINLFVDNITTYFMKPVQIDTNIDAYVSIINNGKIFCKAMNKNFCKVEISMYDDKKDLIAKAFLSAKGIKK
ncbi:putative transcriptional regulator [Clostridium tetanomorphum]|uniref:CBS domain-containing protein n=1 Tax=Clostridium tetanomorphum TaxID=1553 RepID=A0A923EA29_CLOTT|nr:DRTGG domain-containing protein [Clostridium tetanomorphum]KAJ53195.1 CBS domain-containing cytosolic protein [Clostridium tetanomorphum DSM 665]MBC2397501.1 CBS domain-containing protein [Clostridium tetanomorphum]MBP1863597.1 putative transcriptional regulator [Clostridium tetanomorphum]NRS86173.1 putative transcriptional regulator [Clostridium tetanomorphum]NRZ95748.1 putative transcriptional regulator [Clostridium tetanomorphum]